MIRIRIHPTTLLLILLPLTGIFSRWELMILWISATLHETGHIVTSAACGAAFERITVFPFGISAIPKNDLVLSPKKEVLCAAMGPTVNLLAVGILGALPIPASWQMARYAFYCNAVLLCTNLLPILPLDGGRMLYYAFAHRWDAERCETLCRRTAVICLILLLLPSIFVFFTDKNPSWLIIWGYLAGYTVLRRGAI